ncbi:unnamed protein product [Cochlearia groenlandica]
MWCACYHQHHQSLTGSVILNRKANQRESLMRRQQMGFFLSSSSTSSSFGNNQWQIRNNYLKIGQILKPKASGVPPSESGDITTFLLISVAMISMYLVANFVVPSMLFKSLQGQEEEDSD